MSEERGRRMEMKKRGFFRIMRAVERGWHLNNNLFMEKVREQISDIRMEEKKWR